MSTLTLKYWDFKAQCFQYNSINTAVFYNLLYDDVLCRCTDETVKKYHCCTYPMWQDLSCAPVSITAV